MTASVSAVPARRARPWVAVLIGMLVPLVGLLPWWATGARTGLAWPDRGPLVLLPLHHDRAVLLTALLVTGSVLAGLVLRRIAGAQRPAAALWAAAGHVLTLTFLVVQSTLALTAAVGDEGAAGSYVRALVIWSVLSAALALIVLVLIVRTAHPTAALLLSLAAPAVGTWVELCVPSTQPWSTSVHLLLRWIPALLVGAALVWCGLRSWRARGAWVAGLAGLWILPAVDIALQYLVHYRRAGSGEEWLLAGVDLLGLALAPMFAGPPVLLALLVAAVGTAVHALVGNRHPTRQRH